MKAIQIDRYGDAPSLEERRLIGKPLLDLPPR